MFYTVLNENVQVSLLDILNECVFETHVLDKIEKVERSSTNNSFLDNGGVL